MSSQAVAPQISEPELAHFAVQQWPEPATPQASDAQAESDEQGAPAGSLAAPVVLPPADPEPPLVAPPLEPAPVEPPEAEPVVEPAEVAEPEPPEPQPTSAATIPARKSLSIRGDYRASVTKTLAKNLREQLRTREHISPPAT